MLLSVQKLNFVFKMHSKKRINKCINKFIKEKEKMDCFILSINMYIFLFYIMSGCSVPRGPVASTHEWKGEAWSVTVVNLQ